MRCSRRMVVPLIVPALLLSACGYAANGEPSKVTTQHPKLSAKLRAGDAPRCTSTELVAAFWSTPAAKGSQIDGITVTNSSAIACTMTGYPNTILMLDQQGDVVPQVTLPFSDSSGQTSTTDFVPLSSRPDADQTVYATIGTSVPSEVVLNPGDKAALFLATYTSPFPPPTATCISPLQVEIALPSGTNLDVSVPPLKASYAAGSLDPSNSPLWSCFVVVFSPFMSWSTAQQTLDSGSFTQLPGVDNYEYEAAPTTSIPLVVPSAAATPDTGT
jgi:hypothetical protein